MLENTLRYYSLDTGGWFSIYDSIIEIENTLEWIDIENNEYIIFDSDCNLYQYFESDKGYYGYQLKLSGEVNSSLKLITEKYKDDDKVSKEDLGLI
jgi:hypothetical protein